MSRKAIIHLSEKDLGVLLATIKVRQSTLRKPIDPNHPDFNSLTQLNKQMLADIDRLDVILQYEYEKLED